MRVHGFFELIGKVSARTSSGVATMGAYIERFPEAIRDPDFLGSGANCSSLPFVERNREKIGSSTMMRRARRNSSKRDHPSCSIVVSERASSKHKMTHGFLT